MVRGERQSSAPHCIASGDELRLMSVGKRIFKEAWFKRGFTALVVFVLAYSLLLRGLAAPLPSLPGSLTEALANPHYLCLTEVGDEGLPYHHSTSCGECCLGLTRIEAPPPPDGPVITPWPRLVWRQAAPAQPARLAGPHEEAWTRTHSQRGPPESRTPTSFT